MKLGIIGIGPRGLSALERMLFHLSELDSKIEIEILLFEESDLCGYGHVYDINQADTNWINITERALQNLKGRDSFKFNGVEIPAVKKYMESEFAITEDDSEEYPDVFPRRSIIGRYLKLRFDSLIHALKDTKTITIVHKKVVNLNSQSDKIFITTEDDTAYSVDEVLITIGHQPTETDDQLQSWMEYTSSGSSSMLFENSYPIREIKERIKVDNHKLIAIRGFGLAAIDVIRALVDLYGGNFKTKKDNMEILSYTEGKKKLRIIPFSLDGLPTVPKPYNYKIDKKFKPSDKLISNLRINIEKLIKSKPENQLFFVNTMANLITDLYLNYNQNYSLSSEKVNLALVNWILNGTISDKLMTPVNIKVLDMMKLHVEMAEGKILANLDYFAGQVWRHCQPTFYTLFSHSGLSDKVITEIIKIDERIKRYSFGPPVASMKQLILLAEAGTLNLSYADNPDIDLSEKGWHLNKNEQEIVATCMINSVIDSPQILKITSPIIKKLLVHEVIKPVHHEFGIEIRQNGQIVSPATYNPVPIYILGRIAKGSVIGVDAILECFGDRIDQWAENFKERYHSLPSHGLQV